MDFINNTINPAIKQLQESAPDLFQIGVYIVAVAGILFILTALLLTRKGRARTKAHSAVTTGKITDWKIYENSERGTKFPIVTFKPKGSEPITITSTHNAGHFKKKDQSKVIVCYNPKEPTDASVFPRIRFGKLIPLLLLGLICVGIAAYCYTFIKGV